MTFLAAQYFWLIPTLLIPIWFHLRRRSEKKEILFSAVSYIEAKPANRFSVKLEDRLQLLFKCLCWCALIIGLSQPIIQVDSSRDVVFLIDPRVEPPVDLNGPAFWLSPGFPILDQEPEVVWGEGFELLFMATEVHPSQSYKVIGSPDKAFWGHSMYPHQGTFVFETAASKQNVPKPEKYPIYFDSGRRSDAEFLLNNFPDLFREILPISQHRYGRCLILGYGNVPSILMPYLIDTTQPAMWGTFSVPFFPDQFSAKLDENPLAFSGIETKYGGRLSPQSSPWLNHPAAESILRFWIEGSEPSLGQPTFQWPTIDKKPPKKTVELDKWFYGLALICLLLERRLQRQKEAFR